ncbi:MAG: diguanylate cyclase [Comamonadaceae bacterium]|nr:diguanylate cyclase [Comamonadaceae bacterium]
MPLDRQARIRQLLDEYISMYASRDDRLTTHFSENFSGYAGSSDDLIKDQGTWVQVTRHDFAQVKEPIRIEMVDTFLQDLSEDVVVATAFFHIHLPMAEDILSKEMARLVLIFRQEGNAWKIVHSGISIPYHKAGGDEVYPLASLQKRTDELELEVQERTRQLTESQTLYKLLTEDVLDVLWQADANLFITYVSPSDERLRGFKASEVVGHHVFEMFTEEGIALVRKLMAQKPVPGANSRAFVTFEVQHRCKDGRLLWAEVQSRREQDANGKLTGFHGITRETTQRRQMEDQVRQLAFYDPLTKLPNRRLLIDRLNQAIASSQRSGLYGAVMFLDLDNFKALNDAHGHAAGDLLLIEVAGRLSANVRAMDTVARLGGDEFVVMFREFDRDQGASRHQVGVIAEKIRAGLAKPYVLQVKDREGHESHVTHRCSASIGLAMFFGAQATQDEIFQHADAAMYLAKAAGRNRVRFHELEAGANPGQASAAG